MKMPNKNPFVFAHKRHGSFHRPNPERIALRMNPLSPFIFAFNSARNLGVSENVRNCDFNPLGFERIKNQVGLNSFNLTINGMTIHC